MADHQKDPNNLNPIIESMEIDYEPQSKRQKLDENEPLQPESTTKITDLPEVCLSNIFSRLDLESLLNVAMTNKKLQVSAASTFASAFSKKPICLQNIININVPRLYMLDDEIFVRGLKFCLPFLRCFGDAISELVIFDGTYPHVLVFEEYKSKFSHHVDRYVNKYCSEHLTSIQYYGRPAFSLENFRKLFRMVRKIRFVDCAIGNGLPYFEQWFPDLSHLEMNTVCIDEAPTTAIKMPMLSHLSLKINDDGQPSEWNFNKENAINLLRANRLLQSLEIDMPDRQTISIDSLMYITSHNRAISKLIVTDGSVAKDVKMHELERLACDRRLLVELDLPRHRFTADQIDFCIRHLKLLKRFRFQMIDWSEYDRIIQQFGDKWQLIQFHLTVELNLKNEE